MNDWIAIVDDDAATLSLTSQILYKKHCKVSCLRSGMELLEFLEGNRPDLILLDVHMPGMDGFETMAEVSERTDCKSIPVIFLIGEEDTGIEEKGLLAGAVDFIKKPLVPEILLLRVQHTIELSRLQNYLSEEVERKTMELMQQNEQIRMLSIAAETDQMTGLLNKVSVETAIDTICKETQGIFMIANLDNFKLVNDIYGHDAGDKILMRFAEVIRTAVRATDMVGRIGGDEFVAYCEHITEESVLNEKARYINDEIVAYAQDYLGSDLAIPLGVSIGAVSCPDEGRDYLTLFRKADEALYSVKRNGKHGCEFYWESRRPKTDMVPDGTSYAIEILRESPHRGESMILAFEQFRLVYRLLVRLNRNYTIRTAFILFRLESNESDEDKVQAVTKDFCDSVAHSLRSSDVVTRNGTNQCMVLLLHTDIQYGQRIANRIIKKWTHAKQFSNYEVRYEIELI